MKTISVTVDDETHRLARIRAEETGTTVSAMMRDLLAALLESPPESKTETKSEKHRRELMEIAEEFKRKGIGISAADRLTREEMYQRNASR